MPEAKARYARHFRRGDKRINLTFADVKDIALLLKIFKLIEAGAALTAAPYHPVRAAPANARLFHRLSLLGDFRTQCGKLRAIAPKAIQADTIAGQIARQRRKVCRLTVAAQQQMQRTVHMLQTKLSAAGTADVVAFESLIQRTPCCAQRQLEAMRQTGKCRQRSNCWHAADLRHPPPAANALRYAARKLHLFHVRGTFRLDSQPCFAPLALL